MKHKIAMGRNCPLSLTKNLSDTIQIFNNYIFLFYNYSKGVILSNKKLTNAELNEIVESQRQTLGLIQQRLSKMSDQLMLMNEDAERFKNAVARDITFLADRIKVGRVG